jgi:hypothetical protein
LVSGQLKRSERTTSGTGRGVYFLKQGVIMYAVHAESTDRI